MPILRRRRRPAGRGARGGCATSTASRRRVFYPAVHEFAAYRERFGEQHLPHTERAARTEITIPLFAAHDEATQDRVVDALAGGARGMSWDIPLTDVVITEERPSGGRRRACEGGWLTMGPRTQALRGGARRAGRGAPHAVTVSSGTAALHLACRRSSSGPATR